MMQEICKIFRKVIRPLTQQWLRQFVYHIHRLRSFRLINNEQRSVLQVRARVFLLSAQSRYNRRQCLRGRRRSALFLFVMAPNNDGIVAALKTVSCSPSGASRRSGRFRWLSPVRFGRQRLFRDGWSRCHETTRSNGVLLSRHANRSFQAHVRTRPNDGQRAAAHESTSRERPSNVYGSSLKRRTAMKGCWYRSVRVGNVCGAFLVAMHRRVYCKASRRNNYEESWKNALNEK